MSLEAIATIKAPTSTIEIDTTQHIFATNVDGKLILSETTGKPITIAQDKRSGAWYAKAADSFPFFGTKAAKAGLDDLVDAGGVHVPHDDERFRGVWVPIPGQDLVLATEGSKPTKRKKTPETAIN